MLNILFVLFLSLNFITFSKDLIPCTVVRVIDGDTFICKLVNGKKEKIRMIGIDTPESRPNRKAKRDAIKTGKSLKEIIEMGKKATKFTKRFLKKGKKIFLEFDIEKRDRYGRLLAYVWLDKNTLFNELIIKKGFATVYTKPPNVKYVNRFRKAQRIAIKERRGLWGNLLENSLRTKEKQEKKQEHFQKAKPQ